MKELVLMMGIPGAGKSTYLNAVVSSSMGQVRISRDVIRFSMIGDGNYFSKENEVFNEYVNQIQAALDNPNIHKVYADATQISQASRKKVLTRLNLEGVNVSVYWKNTPLKLCLERNKKREPKEIVPESAIQKMYRSMQDPRKDNFHYKEVRLI